ncbi:hypothetical protein [Cellulomonas sp. Root137]|uniref:hypothetical protein n=1 Tax=Cellulomonas sp. Root137 TaxID=1736459 RepID=UPI0006F703F7|nr:hypothetical protein [Cellulomonas sp. Root137]KQY46638.1 hypothetical protein ASD18_04235 [Cellulomonas sp. Root137]
MPRRPHDRSGGEHVGLPPIQLARDHPRNVPRSRSRTGEWERISRGTYLPADVAPALDRPRRVAVGRILGVHDRLRAPHWFSHESAALLWGLPLWRTPSLTHVVAGYTAGSGRDTDVAHHPVSLPADQRASARGLPVTSLERTAVDCASTMPAMEGLIIADAALRAGADRAVLSEIVAGRARRRGIARARAVIELADDGAESPGESAARYVVLRDGLPRPTTQLAVATRLGTFWADMGWEEWRLLLEYDGRPKYDGRSTEAFIQEKRRHDAILEAGWRAVRATKEDLAGRTLATRLARLIPPGHPPLHQRRDLVS